MVMMIMEYLGINRMTLVIQSIQPQKVKLLKLVFFAF